MGFYILVQRLIFRCAWGGVRWLPMAEVAGRWGFALLHRQVGAILCVCVCMVSLYVADWVKQLNR